MENEEVKVDMSKAEIEGFPRRVSLIKLAQSSVYSGQTVDKKKKGNQSRSGTSYAPTDIDREDISLEPGNFGRQTTKK